MTERARTVPSRMKYQIKMRQLMLLWWLLRLEDKLSSKHLFLDISIGQNFDKSEPVRPGWAIFESSCQSTNFLNKVAKIFGDFWAILKNFAFKINQLTRNVWKDLLYFLFQHLVTLFWRRLWGSNSIKIPKRLHKNRFYFPLATSVFRYVYNGDVLVFDSQVWLIVKLLFVCNIIIVSR